MSNPTRRGFLKLLASAGVVAALPAIILAPDGVHEYRMKRGERLSNLHCPDWARVIVVDDCTIDNCTFRNTSLKLVGKNIIISNVHIVGANSDGDAAIMAIA